LTDEANADTKLSRRQFVGTAAAGAVVLGAVAGATKFAPQVTAAGAKALNTTGGVEAASPVGLAAQPSSGSTVWSVPSSWDYTADVVVVGYGGTGVAAALGAYDGGASVLVLEKAPLELAGGNSRACSGGVTYMTPLTDWITIVNMSSYGTVPLDVVTAFCTEVYNLPNW
jgi:hypothetical protein